MRARDYPRPLDWLIGVLVLACLFAVFLMSLPAHAATNSVQICTDGTMQGHVAQDCINALKWDKPKLTDLVLTRPPTSTEEWGNTTTWAVYSWVAPPTQVRTCPLDLNLPAAHGNINGVYVGDPCGSSQVWITMPPGASVDVTCTAPTNNTDNSAIGPTQKPLGFYFWEGIVPGPVYRQVSPKVSDCHYTFPNLEPGNHYFAAITEDALGAQSSSSNEATKTVLAAGQAAPMPPSGLHAPASQPLAYTFPNTDNALIKLAVGTAKPGAVCHNDWVVNGYLRVDVADVNLSPGVDATGIAIFTSCN